MTANPHKGDVEYKLGDQTYTLRYSIDAICVLEDRAGKTLLQLNDDLKDFRTVRMSLVRDILYAGLVEHQPEITVKEAGELIVAAGGSLPVMVKCSEAMARAFPKPEASGTPRPPRNRAARRATGSAS